MSYITQYAKIRSHKFCAKDDIYFENWRERCNKISLKFLFFEKAFDSLILHYYHGECSYVLVFVANFGKATVMEDQLIFGRVRYLHFLLHSVFICLKLVRAYLVNSLEFWLYEEKLSLILNAQFDLWLQVTNFVTKQKMPQFRRHVT